MTIAVGNKFKDRSGTEWQVIRTRPGGKVELKTVVGFRFATRLHREVSQMERAA